MTKRRGIPDLEALMQSNPEPLETLQSEVARLEERLALLESPRGESANGVVTPPATFGRRQMLRRAGMVAAGAAAATVASGALRPAAAADGDNIVIGSVNAGASQTLLKVTALANGEDAIFAVTDGATGSSTFNAAVAGFAGGTVADVGIAGFTSRNAQSGAGVVGSGALGFMALSSTTHLKLAGPGRDNSQLPTTGTVTGGTTLGGEITYDRSANLWLGTGSGGWRKLAGSSTAGAFHAITPGRIYDSRPSDKLLPGTNRLIQVTGIGGVPAGARAILGTLTITETESTFGFITITPGSSGSTGASSINWFGPNQTLATGISTALDSSGQARFFNNSPAATHVILDATGYFL